MLSQMACSLAPLGDCTNHLPVNGSSRPWCDRSGVHAPLFHAQTGRGTVRLEVSGVPCPAGHHIRDVPRGIITVFFSPCSAASPAIIRANTLCSWPLSNQWRSATHLHRFQRLYSVLWGPYSFGASRQRKPLRLMSIIPLRTRLSSTRGLP